MTVNTQSDQSLAINGGTPCVTDKPASYLHGPQEIGDEEIAAVTQVLRTKHLFRFGKSADQSPTAQFEARFREMVGVQYALAVNSGTSALLCGMIGLGVSSGDEVIVPAYTYIATPAAVLGCGGIPVVAEVDNSLTLDPADVERKITPRTRLIVPVHMRGTPSRMDRIMEVARRHGVPVLEDCAQANGGSFKGRPLGSIGDAGAFSLQHFKIITAGEGGAFVTSDKTAFDRGACFHDSAYAFWKERENQLSIDPFLGQNYRMSEMNGALALAQLAKRDRILARLRQIKKRLLAGIDGLQGLELQDVPDPAGDCAVSLVLYAPTPERAKWFAQALRAEGMGAGTCFDEGIPDRHIYYHWSYVLQKRSCDRHGHPWRNAAQPCQVEYSRDMCPQSLGYLHRAVAIPLTQVMTDAHVDSCAAAIRKVFPAL
jgi:8-amino-3,8-dideoxy-alpha-D-manno-octulosonate transaminase